MYRPDHDGGGHREPDGRQHVAESVDGEALPRLVELLGPHHVPEQYQAEEPEGGGDGADAPARPQPSTFTSRWFSAT